MLASKAGAYGGSELGSILGGAVGPPIFGSIIGDTVGEKVGEKVTMFTGLEKFAKKTEDNMAKVIGRDGVDKVGKITLTVMENSGTEIIGSVIDTMVGKEDREKVIEGTGLDKFAKKTGDNMAKLIGRDGVEQVGEITLTVLGESETEECLCFPCLPASQVL